MHPNEYPATFTPRPLTTPTPVAARPGSIPTILVMAWNRSPDRCVRLPEVARRSANFLQLVGCGLGLGRLRIFSNQLFQYQPRVHFVSQGQEGMRLFEQGRRHLVALGVLLDHLLVFENGFLVGFFTEKGLADPELGVVGVGGSRGSAGSVPRTLGGLGRCCPDRRLAWPCCKALPRTALWRPIRA